MLVFPSNPNAGDVFAPGPGFPSWVWDGGKWTRAAAAFTLGALTDVELSLPFSDGQVLTWDAATAHWENQLPADRALTDLPDVGITAPVADGALLTWNAATSQWENRPPATVDLSTLAGPVTINGAAGAPSLVLNAPSDNWAGWFNGAAYGLRIASGEVIGDRAFQVTNQSSSFSSFILYGDGSGFLGPANKMSWNAAGNFIINTPSGGIAFIVNSNSDSQLRLNTPVGQQYVTQAWSVGGAVKAQAYWDDTSQTFSIGGAVGGGTRLLSNDQVRMTISSDGQVNVTGNVAANGGFSVAGVPLALSGTVLITWTVAEARVNTGTPSVSAYATYAIPTAGTYVIEFMAPIWQNVDGTAGFNFTPYFSGTIISGTGVWISTGPNVSGQVAFNNNAGGTTFSIPFTNTWQWSIYFKGFLVAGSAGQFAVAFSQNALTSQITSYMGHASRASFLSVTRIR